MANLRYHAIQSVWSISKLASMYLQVATKKSCTKDYLSINTIITRFLYVAMPHLKTPVWNWDPPTRADSLQATPILARNSRGTQRRNTFRRLWFQIDLKKNQTQIQIACLVEETVSGEICRLFLMKSSMASSGAPSLLICMNFHLEVIQLCWRWTLRQKKQMENDLVSVCLVRQCQ